METLRKIKLKMKTDEGFEKTLVRSAKDEILIDLDGDGAPDIALMDSVGDGDIDTLAVDLTGDGEFDLYFHNSDGNGLPDIVFLNADGAAEVSRMDGETEKSVARAARNIFAALADGEYKTDDLNSALDGFRKEIDLAGKRIKSVG